MGTILREEMSRWWLFVVEYTLVETLENGYGGVGNIETNGDG